MRLRRGTNYWPGELGHMVEQYRPGDIVVSNIVEDSAFTGVVREVHPKLNKVLVAWGGGSLVQHDPDEIMLHPYGYDVLKDRLGRDLQATCRRVRGRQAQNEALKIDELGMKVASFFKDSPNPDDEKFHKWAEDEKLDVHKAEAGAYKLATVASTFVLAGRAMEEGLKASDVDPDELKMGIDVELEHTTSKEMAERIALDHLAEISDYYTRLKKMEEAAGVEG
jgi:hypothetical protein